MTKPCRQVYLDHLRHGQLAYQFSPKAGQAVFYPREVSPHDINETLEWKVSAGFGTVYSTTVVRDAKSGDRNIVLVDCDEGFRLMSRVEGMAASDVHIGQRVRFEPRSLDTEDEDPYPVFVPIEGATA